MNASTKVTGLTGLNVMALQEAAEAQLFPANTVIKATTVTFPTDALTAADLVRSAIATLGTGNAHPSKSLQAVARKFERVASAEAAAATPQPTLF